MSNSWTGRTWRPGRGGWPPRPRPCWTTFGRIAITSELNPKLRDKASREGLIDNQACRELRYLVIGLLKTAAGRFFGSDSELRAKALPEIQERNRRAKDAEKRARKRRTSVLGAALRDLTPVLEGAAEEVGALRSRLADVVAAGDAAGIHGLAGAVQRAEARRSKLRLPPRPRKLRNLERKYRAYRDQLAEHRAAVEALAADWTQAVQTLPPVDPWEFSRSTLLRHQKHLSDALRRWARQINHLLDAERQRQADRIDADRKRYYLEAASLLGALADGSRALASVLDEFQAIRLRLDDEFEATYAPYVRALEQLAEGIDLESAFVWSSDERDALERRLGQFHALAQLGITVEIVGHELHEIDAQVSRNLRRLPQAAQETDAYPLALAGYEALTTRLKFLSPVRLSGPRLRETITGREIRDYLSDVFSDRFEARRIRLDAVRVRPVGPAGRGLPGAPDRGRRPSGAPDHPRRGGHGAAGDAAGGPSAPPGGGVPGGRSGRPAPDPAPGGACCSVVERHPEPERCCKGPGCAARAIPEVQSTRLRGSGMFPTARRAGRCPPRPRRPASAPPRTRPPSGPRR